jgi:hypothetical protein
MSKRQKFLAALGVAAIAAAPAAAAQPGHGRGNDKPKMYIFHGTYNADGSVHVTGGNGRVRKQHLVGTDVAFDYTNARVIVADTNGDTVSDINDVQSPDAVLVQAKLGKSDPGPQPFAARKLIDQTNPPVDDSSDDSAQPPSP